ncbi:hypothetical protein EBX31_04260 [bacterium]|nr:hypothetical protein [bacterium]
MKPAALMLGLMAGLSPVLAENDEDSIEGIKATRIRNGTDANPEMQDFVGGVYEGTPEGNYRKVGNTYFKPDGGGAVVRSGNTFSGDGSATIKSGANYFQDGTISRAVGNAVFKTDSEDDAKGKVQLRKP